jgi:polysaccharide biosynthesis transport protein
MIENTSSQSLNSHQKRNSVHPLPQLQPFSWSEEQENDWTFQDFLEIIRRRGLLITGVAIAMMTIVIIALTWKQRHPEYQGKFQMLVESINNDNQAVDVVKEPNVTNSTLDYESQIQVLKSPELMGGIIKQLQASYPDITYDSLINSLTVTQLNQTKIIEVRYQSNDPNKVKVVLDKIAQDYLNYSLQKRQTKLRQGIKFVEKQLPFIQNRVDQLQKELQLFRQKYNFSDPESKIAQISTQFDKLFEQRQIVDLQLAEARANLALIQDKNGALAALNSAVVYQQLIAQLRQLDVQISTESARFQEDNPTIQTLREKRENLVPLLYQESQRFLGVKLAEAATKVQTLEKQSQEVTKGEYQLKLQRQQLPILTRHYTELQRKLQIANESLNRFLTTRENLQIKISQTELDWQLLQAPKKPDKPLMSDIKSIWISGLGASIILGIGAGLLKEKLDNTYHDVHVLKDKTKLPLLGNIPFDKQLKSHPAHNITQKNSLVKIPDSVGETIPRLAVSPVPDQDYSKYSTQFLEALRVLHTNIQLLSSDSQIRSIIISSAMPGDGKSTVAFHLAQIATAMGQKVLLVDADLRQPKIHTLSDLNNQWGLSNLISTNLPAEEVIHQIPSMQQLSVITAGPIPPDPTKLLSSEKMKRLMADFHNNFDLVIYDAPPLVGLADASLIAPHTDGVLMVVRIDKTDSSILKRTLDKVKVSRMNVLGVVGNGQKSNFSVY